MTIMMRNMRQRARWMSFVEWVAVFGIWLALTAMVMAQSPTQFYHMYGDTNNEYVYSMVEHSIDNALVMVGVTQSIGAG